jgi:hypothetical protein
MIEELTSILTVKCSPLERFGDALDENDGPVATDPAFTGSPPVKKQP